MKAAYYAQEAFGVAERMRTRASAGGDIVSMSPSGSRDNLTSLFEDSDRYGGQLRAYRDHQYSAIQPVAKRVAGQNVCLGIMNAKTKPSRAKRFNKNLVPSVVKESFYENLNIVEDHPLLDLLNRPNPLMQRWHLFFCAVASMMLTGKAFWWINIPENGEATIWPVPTSWVKPNFKNGKFDWLMRVGNKEPKPVPAEEMCYFCFPDPADPIEAVSPTQAQSKAITIDEAIQTSQYAAFKNGINPGLAIIPGDITSTDFKSNEKNQKRPLLEKHQRQQITYAIMQHFKGAINHGHPLILDALIHDVKKLNHKPTEMDWMKSSEMIRDRIYLGYGTNPISAGMVQDANRASAAVADQTLCNLQANPFVELISEVATQKLTPWFSRDSQRMFLWLEKCTPNDPEIEVKKWDLAAKNKAVTINEIRMELLGIGPREDGDDLIGSEEPQDDPQENPREDEEEKRKLASVTPALLTRLHKSAEGILLAATKAFFAVQRGAILKRAAELPDEMFSSIDASVLSRELYAPGQWTSVFLKQYMEPAMTKVMLLGAAAEITFVSRQKADIQQTFENALGGGLPQPIVAGIGSHLAELEAQSYWAKIQEYTDTQLTAAIKAQLEAGGGRREISKVIQGLTAFSNDRSMLIARTEQTGSLGAGGHFARNYLDAKGLIKGKQWWSILDARCRVTHAINHGVIIPNSQDFNVGGNSAPYPGHHSLPAEERCACRCVSTAVA